MLRDKEDNVIFCPKCNCSGYIEKTLSENHYFCTNVEEHYPKKDYTFTISTSFDGLGNPKRPHTL